MELGVVLQLFGVSIMATGSIMAIEGVKGYIKKTKEETKKDYEKMGIWIGLIVVIKVAEILLQKKDIKNMKGLEKSINEESEKQDKELRLMFIFLLYYSLKGYFLFLKFLEATVIKIGIIFILIGMFIQAAGIWLNQ
jgi:hypothetical protein